MSATRIYFTVNEYDKDGDVFKEGIFFNFGDTKIWVCQTADELDEIIDNIRSIKDEIKENY